MPLYEYECDTCGHRFEVIHQRFSDPPIEICTKCGGPVHKLLSSPAIQFKGSGWYITDYARAGKTDPAATPAKSEGGAGDSKAGTAADAKSDNKKDESTTSKADAKPTSSSETKSETKSESKTDSKRSTPTASS